jgi:hypothetical protein
MLTCAHTHQILKKNIEKLGKGSGKEGEYTHTHKTIEQIFLKSMPQGSLSWAKLCKLAIFPSKDPAMNPQVWVTSTDHEC